MGEVDKNFCSVHLCRLVYPCQERLSSTETLLISTSSPLAFPLHDGGCGAMKKPFSWTKFGAFTGLTGAVGAVGAVGYYSYAYSLEELEHMTKDLRKKADIILGSWFPSAITLSKTGGAISMAVTPKLPTEDPAGINGR